MLMLSNILWIAKVKILFICMTRKGILLGKGKEKALLTDYSLHDKRR
jgi:hypothetical protein